MLKILVNFRILVNRKVWAPGTPRAPSRRRQGGVCGSIRGSVWPSPWAPPTPSPDTTATATGKTSILGARRQSLRGPRGRPRSGVRVPASWAVSVRGETSRAPWRGCRDFDALGTPWTPPKLCLVVWDREREETPSWGNPGCPRRRSGGEACREPATSSGCRRPLHGCLWTPYRRPGQPLSHPFA